MRRECYNTASMSTLFFNLSIIFYGIGLAGSAITFFTKGKRTFQAALAAVIVGFVVHTGFLIYRGIEKAHFPMTDMKESLAFFAWTVSLCFFVSYLRYRIRALGLFLLPLVAALMLGTIFIQSSPIPDILKSFWIYFHVTFLILAYGMFFVTFIAGLLYLFQERELKSKKPKTFYYRLPSLSLLDDLFYKFLIVGFGSMTLGILAGVIWAKQDWAKGWESDAKVIATMVTWAIYLVLIYLRTTAGWRGKRAAIVNVAGFLSVLFTLVSANFLGGVHKF